MENATAQDHLFRIESRGPIDHVTPSAYTGGPWNARHQHGGAVAALLARCLERIESPVAMRLSRITIDMFRGVPVAPLRVETRIVRGGKRIQSAEANLFDGATCVARATGLRIRSTDSIEELEALPDRDPAVGRPPEILPEFRLRPGIVEIPAYVRAIDLLPSRAKRCGELATTWGRLRCPVVEGEPTTPIVRLAALADFASGTGNAMDYTQFTSINPDLSIHVLREPRSDWIALRGVTERAGDGIGQSAAVAHDLAGPIARVNATVLLDRRRA